MSLSFLPLGAKAAAATLTVTKTADTNDGMCDVDCSLREAITAAASGDTIVFSSLFDTPRTVVLAGSQLVINKDLTIAGAGADRLTVSGNGQSRVFHVQTSARLTLSGMTITGGNGHYGGGIFNEGRLDLAECHITGNTAGSSGGGVGSLLGSASINNSTISNNTAELRGGGIWHDSVGLTLRVTNSTVSGNTVSSASGEGGGIWAMSTAGLIIDIMIWSSTITDNFPGGVSAVGTSNGVGVDVLSSIIAANRDNGVFPDVDGHFSTSGFNLIGNIGTADGLDGGFGSSLIGNPIVQADPKLGPLANNGGPTPTHALLPCSLAIDRGKNFVGVNDQRGTGFSRVVDFPEVRNPTDGDGSDVGSLEMQSFTPAICNTGLPTVEALNVTMQQGTSGTFDIARVSDPDGLFGIGLFIPPPNPSNGVAVSHSLMRSLGVFSADIAASCTASAANFTLVVGDLYGEHDVTETLAVTVTPETTPPALVLPTHPITLFPYDHKFTTVNMLHLVAGASDKCDPNVNFNSVVIEQVTSDEPENAAGDSDGNTNSDILISPDCKSVQLRAERDGNSNGRVYVIQLRVRDASGNTTRATRKVSVPLSRNSIPAIENAPQYVVPSSCR
jgi:CSLREA domain-containing protein